MKTCYILNLDSEDKNIRLAYLKPQYKPGIYQNLAADEWGQTKMPRKQTRLEKEENEITFL